MLVIGGYGLFGSRLVQRLAAQPGLQVVVAGRRLALAQAQVQRLMPTAKAQLLAAALDTESPDLEAALRSWSPQVVVHASGPFQGKDYAVARACVRVGAHCIDLADGRAFVTGITAVHDEAVAAGVLVASGASSVPALSSAVVDQLAHGLPRLSHIDIGISPGNRTERGLSTLQGVLSYCGQRIPLANGDEVVGWGHSYRHTYAQPVGLRLLSPCDVPDLDVLPTRYPGQPQVRFGAGLELAWMHRGMNLMALAARWGWVKNWASHAVVLKRVADIFKTSGSDTGAMHVTVSGVDAQGVAHTRHWELLATHGDGPFVPTLAAAALVRRLASGARLEPGAYPCVGLLALSELETVAQGLSITMGLTE